jgi:hypothetical protein
VRRLSLLGAARYRAVGYQCLGRALGSRKMPRSEKAGRTSRQVSERTVGSTRQGFSLFLTLCARKGVYELLRLARRASVPNFPALFGTNAPALALGEF